MTHPLVGTWSLQQYLFSGRKKDDFHRNFCENSYGTLIYDESMNFSAQVCSYRRPEAEEKDPFLLAADQTIEAYRSYIAYFGTYEIQAGQDTVHHIVRGSLYPSWQGTVQERYFELGVDQNQLTISTPPIYIENNPMQMTLHWQRL
ncbi:MAG: lipocalin-like domain-containing protein [Zetaproteobacteria bacterium]|nr:lipocalin-like domain-containing protein [Zetaproteobacteria bacterium]